MSLTNALIVTVACFWLVQLPAATSAESSTSSPESRKSALAYNVMKAVDEAKSVRRFCIWQLVDQARRPIGPLDHDYHPINNQTGHDKDFCREPPTDFHNQVVVMDYSDMCPLQQQVDYLVRARAAGLVVSLPCDLNVTHLSISTATNLTVVLANDWDIVDWLVNDNRKRVNQSQWRVKIFPIAPENVASFDYAVVVIWLLATGSVVIGSWWSGRVRHALFFNKNYRRPNKRQEEDSDQRHSEAADKKDAPEEEAFLNVHPIMVLVFVCAMAGMLMILYFFYQYLVYIIIGLFMVASVGSLFVCLEGLLQALVPTKHLKSFRCMLCLEKCGPIFYHHLALTILSISVVACWFVVRKEPTLCWWLQDILGVCFSINMLRTIRLPSFKICIILLTLLCIYDIFFVFITPLFTERGNSIMVDVATGGEPRSRCGRGTREQLPMVFRVPHLNSLFADSDQVMDVCTPNRDSILGFGDILVPGLLVSYCYSFDLILAGGPLPIYFITASVFYGIGMIVCFAALFLMKGAAQPALFYLVPLTIIPTLLIAWLRGQLNQIWLGPENFRLKQLDQKPDEEQASERVKAEETGGHREDNLLIDEQSTGSGTLEKKS